MNNLMKKLLFSPLARTVYLPILALALLAGCNNGSTGSSDASSSDAGGPGFSMQGGEQGDEEMIRKEVLARARRFSRTVTGPLYMLEIQYAHDTISAEKLYKGARDIIEKAVEDEAITGNEAIPSNAIEFVIPKLLDHLLQDGNASPEAVGYFTDMLMSIESPNADMILEALHVLDGYWTEAHIRTTANEAIRNAEQWLSHTDEGVPYRGKDRPAIVASVQHLRSIASL
jgi:hypothetical protein